MSQNFHEDIAQLCIGHFKSLPKTGKPTPNEWTVLSCVVKQNTNHLEVVSLGTGSKCIGKPKMSPKGDILNDSHAETICRRAFLRYIYDQLGDDSEVFYYDCATLKYCLRSSISFHFFTSHVPCGDAAIFPKQDLGEFGTILSQTCNPLKRPVESNINGKVKQTKLDEEPNSSDIFRTGAKCLPHETNQDLYLSGAEYHTTGAVRTKPGRGDPTLSVSCSDKIAKWGVLGIQGALLSVLLKEPIYLSSFTIAGQTPYCEEALKRALYGRFSLTKLQANIVPLGQALMGFEFCKNDSKQPCPSSIAWCKTKTWPLEVAVEGKKQGVTKKKQNTKAGRLQISKIELFRTFLDVVGRLKLDLFVNEQGKMCYVEAKALAVEYQKSWEVLKHEGFKIWTIKDDALLNFVVD